MKAQLKKWFGAGAIFAFGLVLYGPILGMPLIYDTLLHLRIAEGLNWTTVWLPTEAFGFYRPMTFTPILFTRTLFGDDVALFYNLMNLLQHAINGVLLYFLILVIQRDETQRVYRALFAALLFIAFPFSYQAVAIYGHNVHPAVTGLILLGLLTSLHKGKRWQVATAAIFVIGLLTHESFILFGVLGGMIAFLQALHARREDAPTRHVWESVFKSAVRQYGIYTALGLVYVGAYQFLPISRAPQVDEAGGVLWTKLLYVMQGLSHPLALLGRFTPLSAQTIILIAFSLTLTFSIWRRSWVSLVGWGWWFLASALVVLPLPTGYLLNGPRLLYLGSVGVAIVWATILSEKQPNGRGLLRGGTARFGLIALLAILTTNVLFVRGRLRDYAELTHGIDVLRQKTHEGIVLLNHPQWFAPARNVYPLGAEFVQQLGDYLFIEEWTTRNLPNNPQTWGFRVDEQLSTVSYGYGVHAQHQLGAWEPVESDWFLTRYTDTGLQFEAIGGITKRETAVIATFQPYRLVSARAESCAANIPIDSRWQNSDPAASSTLTLFVQLLDENGVLIGQNDAPPLQIRPDLLPNGAYDMVDQRMIAVPSGANPATVLLGVYDYVTGERKVAFMADGTPLPDNALRLELQACR
jgi:hypothetical protein